MARPSNTHAKDSPDARKQYFAYNDTAAFNAQCSGYFSVTRNGIRVESRNVYGIRTGTPGTTRRTAYLAKKFYNPTTRKWRISVSKY